MSDEIVENPAAEYREVATHVSLKMIQATSLIAPPIQLSRQLYRKNFSVNRFLRNSAIWTFGFGTASGLAMTWLRLRNEPDIAIYDRAFRIRENASQVRVDDYSKVGALLGALVTQTIFMRRSRMIYNIFGGAALGAGGGVIAHLVKSVQERGLEKEAKQAKDALPKPADLADGIAKGT